MDAIMVLLDAKGAVIGTTRETDPTGDAPTATLVPQEGQRLVKARLSAAESRLEATELLAALRSKKL